MTNSRYAASEVGKYLLNRFGFRFLELPNLQPLEDLIWETAREAQLHRRELAATASAVASDLAYVQQSLSGDVARSVYEPLDRVGVHQRAQDVNALERRVQSLLNAHAGMVKAWDEHGKRDAEDHAIHTAQAAELRELKTAAQGHDIALANLEEARTAALVELEQKERELAEALAGQHDVDRERELANAELERDQQRARAEKYKEELRDANSTVEGMGRKIAQLAGELRASQDARQEQQNRADEAEEAVRAYERLAQS